MSNNFKKLPSVGMIVNDEKLRSTLRVAWVAVLFATPLIISLGWSVEGQGNLRPDNRFNKVLWPLTGLCTALAWVFTIRSVKSGDSAYFWLLLGAYFIGNLLAGVLMVYDSQAVAAINEKEAPAVTTDVLFVLAISTAVSAAFCGVVSFSTSPIGGAFLTPFVAWCTYLTFVHGIGHSTSRFQSFVAEEEQQTQGDRDGG